MYQPSPIALTFDGNSFDPTNCIATGFELLKRSPGTYIVSGLIFLVVAMIPIVGIILYGPLLAGFYALTLNDLKRGGAEFGDLFDGFKKFISLVVLGILATIPSVLSELYDLVYTVIDLIPDTTTADPHFFSEPPLATLPTDDPITSLLMLASFGAILIAMVVWQVLFFFSIPLKLEHDISIFESIKLSAEAVWYNLGNLIVLMIFSSLVAMAGFLICCIGVIAAIPIILSANAVAYRMAFPNGDPESFSSAGRDQGSMLGLND